MMTNTLMWRVAFRNFSNPCTVIDVLADLMFDVGVDMLADMETPEITLELMVRVSCIEDVLTNLLLDVLIIDSVTVIDVNMLGDDNVNDLPAVMTPLEFTLSAP